MTKISIVEDLPDVTRSIVNNISTRDGLQVIATYDHAQSAIEAIPYDGTEVVLLDLGLPGEIQGIECMINLKSINERLKFLVFTIFEDDDKLFDALRYGANGYILKQDGIPGVIKALRELQSGGAPMSYKIAQRVLDSFRRATSSSSKIETLTPKQKEVLTLLSSGLLNKEIGAKMGIKEDTVKQHVYAMFKKLHVNNRVEAMKKYWDK